MRAESFHNNIHYLKFQRNIFAAIAFLLAISLVMISIFLFLKNERIVIVPPSLEKEIWIEGNRVSPSYLEQQAHFLGQLLLNKTPLSARDQNTILLKHAAPDFFSLFKQRLDEEEKTMIEQGSSFVFFPKEINVFPEKMQVVLSGERQVFLGGKIISSSKEVCTLSFKTYGQSPLLDGVEIESG